MAQTRVYLSESSWDNALQAKAPLKWATKQMNYLISITPSNNGITWYSKLNNVKPVKYNTVFYNTSTYFGYPASICTLNTLDMDGNASKTSFVRNQAACAFNGAGWDGRGYWGDKESFAANNIEDIVALVNFPTLASIKSGLNIARTFQPVILSGYTTTSQENGVNYITWLSNTQNRPLDATQQYNTEFNDYVVPMITWYYREKGADYPRKKMPNYLERFFPFVPFTSSTLEFYNNNEYYAQQYGFLSHAPNFVNGDWYFNLTPAFTNADFPLWKYPQQRDYPIELPVYQYEPLTGNLRLHLQPPVPYVKLFISTEDGYITGTTRLCHTWEKVSTATGQYFATPTNAFREIYAFPDVQTALDYYADWGIICTQNESEALNMPITPEPPNTPTDPPVINIPSYPDNTTDTIEINPPNFTASSFGQCKVYKAADTQPLIKWFGTNTFWQDINRLFANPIDAVFGLRMYNLDIVDHDAAHVEASAKTSILNVSTDIPCYAMMNGYNTIVEGGTYQYTAYYGNFADFLNTSYEIFIPYVGIRRLNPSDVVNRTLHLQYAVDFATGNSTVFLLSDNKLIMSTSCNISAEIPIQTSNINDVTFQSLMGVLTGAVNGGKTGFLTGAKAGGAGAIGGAAAGAIVGGVTGGLDNYLNSVEYGYQGGISGNNAYAMIVPFLIIRRFPIANTGNYANLFGLANAGTVTFGSIKSGYIKADTVEINTRATDRERDEIIALLKNGVHLK